MQLVVVTGITSFDPSGWRLWHAGLQKFLPDINLHILRRLYFLPVSPWAQARAREVIDEGVALLQTEEPTILIGYSLGGLIAKTMIQRSKDHQVKLLVTLGTPHRAMFGVQRFIKNIGVPESVHVPTFTYGGLQDRLVHARHTHMDGAQTHTILNCNHRAYFRVPEIRERVIGDIIKFLR